MSDVDDPLEYIQDEEIKKAILFLMEALDSREDYFEWDEASKTVKFCVPASEHEFQLDKGTFLAFASECKSYKVEDDRFIRTDRRTLMLVEPISLKAQFISYYQERNVNFTFGGGITMHFHPVNALVAVAAYKGEAYSKHSHPPEHYPSLEILYANAVAKKSPAAEERLFESFMFELAATEDLVFSTSSFNYDLEDNPFEELEGKVFATSFRPLEPFNEGMRLYPSRRSASAPGAALATSAHARLGGGSGVDGFDGIGCGLAYYWFRCMEQVQQLRKCNLRSGAKLSKRLNRDASDTKVWVIQGRY